MDVTVFFARAIYSYNRSKSTVWLWWRRSIVHTPKGLACASHAPASKLAAQYRELLDKTLKTVLVIFPPDVKQVWEYI